MTGRIDVYADGRVFMRPEDAVSKIGDEEGRGAGRKSEALGGESIGPHRKREVGEALKIGGGECGRGGSGGKCGGVGNKIVDRRRTTGGKRLERRATRHINLGDRDRVNLIIGKRHRHGRSHLGCGHGVRRK